MYDPTESRLKIMSSLDVETSYMEGDVKVYRKGNDGE